MPGRDDPKDNTIVGLLDRMHRDVWLHEARRRAMEAEHEKQRRALLSAGGAKAMLDAAAATC